MPEYIRMIPTEQQQPSPRTSRLGKEKAPHKEADCDINIGDDGHIARADMKSTVAAEVSATAQSTESGISGTRNAAARVEAEDSCLVITGCKGSYLIDESVEARSNGHWYNATVLALDSPAKRVRVLWQDFGTFEWVPMMDVRRFDEATTSSIDSNDSTNGFSTKRAVPPPDTVGQASTAPLRDVHFCVDQERMAEKIAKGCLEAGEGSQNVEVTSSTRPLLRNEVVEVKSGLTWYAATVLCVKGKKVQILWKTGELDDVHINRVRRPHETSPALQKQRDAQASVQVQENRQSALEPNATAEVAENKNRPPVRTRETSPPLITSASTLEDRTMPSPASTRFTLNEAVEVKSGSQWYPATVLTVKDAKVHILYNSGTFEWVFSCRVRRPNDSSPKVPLENSRTKQTLSQIALKASLSQLPKRARSRSRDVITPTARSSPRLSPHEVREWNPPQRETITLHSGHHGLGNSGLRHSLVSSSIPASTRKEPTASSTHIKMPPTHRRDHHGSDPQSSSPHGVVPSMQLTHIRSISKTDAKQFRDEIASMHDKTTRQKMPAYGLEKKDLRSSISDFSYIEKDKDAVAVNTYSNNPKISTLFPVPSAPKLERRLDFAE